MVSNLLPGNRFVSSNTNGSLFVHFYNPIINKLSSKILDYNSSIGFANSVVYSNRILVTGHENGFIIIWNDTGSIFQQINVVNISSSDPIYSPYPSKNIRALSRWQDRYIVSGSEDGDICIIEIPSGNVIARKRYNIAAQRGINDLQVYENYLILSNCAVGKDDKNTWLYKLNDKNVSINLIHAINLQKNPNLLQVFNFNVVMGPFESSLYWFA
jgi:WD40 repeat protein